MTYEEQLQLEAAMSQVVTDGAQLIINADLDKKQRRWASDEAEKAWQRSVQMYNLQNEYNSPESQMSRLQAAGLNPHLMYGQGTVGNTATSTPQYHPAEARWRDRNINNPFPMAMQAVSVGLQQDNLKAQNDILREERDLKRMEAINKAIDMVINYGDPVTNDLPDKYYDEQYKTWIELQSKDHQFVPGLKDHQLDAAKYDNDIRKQRVANLATDGRLKGALADIAQLKVEGIIQNGYDAISKDNFADNQLKKLFGESGTSAATNYIVRILPSLLRAVGK